MKHLKLLVPCNCCKCNIEKLEKKKKMEKKMQTEWRSLGGLLRRNHYASMHFRNSQLLVVSRTFVDPYILPSRVKTTYFLEITFLLLFSFLIFDEGN